jgi:hypothetical protein
VEQAQHFMLRFVMPRLVELDLEDVMPFRNPLPILVDYLNSSKVVAVENTEESNSGFEVVFEWYQHCDALLCCCDLCKNEVDRRM